MMTFGKCRAHCRDPLQQEMVTTARRMAIYPIKAMNSRQSSAPDTVRQHPGQTGKQTKKAREVHQCRAADEFLQYVMKHRCFDQYGDSDNDEDRSQESDDDD